MNNCDHLCRNCRGRYICLDAQINGLNSTCAEWKPRTTKVKPRRLCDFCERRRPIDDDYGRYTMEFTRLIPFPSINLTTGEQKEIKSALFLYEDKDDGEVGSFPIKFCPLCGRKLDGGGEK